MEHGDGVGLAIWADQDDPAVGSQASPLHISAGGVELVVCGGLEIHRLQRELPEVPLRRGVLVNDTYYISESGRQLLLGIERVPTSIVKNV